ncbi:hypothetical protein ACJIZ3_024459 [Penstemon smallii]|uniref:Uncharacterized protein n=1 Tax=Penstemon smallii TaxID=265156 RepID=A0ABD3TV19_9LAMI
MNSMSVVRCSSLAIIGFILVALSQYSYAQGMAAAPSPAPIAPSNDGTGILIDQGVAYFLLLVALAITYLVH